LGAVVESAVSIAPLIPSTTEPTKKTSKADAKSAKILP
jgi:hypothetical protein